tara:strand:- start:9806 stop:10276 length:471 start_codon:yes stop_codon:yes gene_type:complete
MATVTSAKSVELTQIEDTEPSDRLDAAKRGGVKRSVYATYVVDAADEIGSGGVIEMCKIPKGAYISNAHINIPASGTGGQFDVGWAANGDLSADLDAIFAAVDPGGAAVDADMDKDVAAAYMYKLDDEATIQLTCIEATADAGGDTIELEIEYVLD